MSLSQKIFLSILSLYVIFDFTLGSLVGLFLWETTKESSQIIIYYISLFTSIILSTQWASILTNKYGAKKIYASSIYIGILQALILLILGSDVVRYIIPFGILAGTGIGLQSISYTLIVGAINKDADTTRFLGLKSSVMNIVSILAVPAVTALVSFLGSYVISYMISFIAGLIIIVLLQKISYVNTNSDTNLRSALSLFDIDEVKIFIFTRFLYGIYNGPMWAVLGVVTLIFVGDVSRWGIISTGFTILSIVSTYMYSKIAANSIRQAISIFATFIFASIALLLATNWNFAVFMAYQFSMVILNSSFSLHYEGVIYSLTNDNQTIKDNMGRILSLGEVAIGLGRIIPLIILLVAGFSFDNPLMLQILFVIISVIPILILSKLGSIIPHTTRYATIHS